MTVFHQYERAVLPAVEEVENALVAYTREERRKEALLPRPSCGAEEIWRAF